MEAHQVDVFMNAVKNGDMDLVSLYLKNGILQQELNKLPLVYSCLPLASTQQMLKLLSDSYTIVVDSNLINQNVDNPLLLQFLLQLLRSQGNSVTLNETDVLSTAISKRAPLESFQLLISYGADPNKVHKYGKYGTSVLLKAVQIDGEWSTRVMKLLLDGGAKLNFHKPALQLAIEATNEPNNSNNLYKFEKVKILLAARASPNVSSKNGTAIFSAITFLDSGSVKRDIIRLLISRGANVNATHYRKRTPLMVAVRENNEEEVIDILIKAGANLNVQDADKNNILHHCLSCCHEDEPNFSRIQKFLKHGVDVNLENSNGETPLTMSIKRNHNSATTEFLRNASIITNIQTQYKYLMSNLAALQDSDSMTIIIKYLLQHGANPNSVNLFDKTPLIIAIQDKVNLGRISLLVQSGADLLYTDKQSLTLLHHAVGYLIFSSNNNAGQLILQYLLDHGVNPNLVDDKGMTPLMRYIYYVSKVSKIDMNVVKMLVEAGTDLKVKDKRDETIFHNIATLNEPSSKFLFLFEGHEDLLSWEDSNGMTFFYLLVIKAIEENENLDVIVNMCRRVTEEHILILSRDVQKILLKIFYSTKFNLRAFQNSIYFQVLLSPPFKIVNDQVFQEKITNAHQGASLLVTKHIECNFVSSILMKFNFETEIESQNLLEFLTKLENLGIEVAPRVSNSFSPLTALLLTANNSKYHFKQHLILEIFEFLIKRGASVTESRLQFTENLSSDLHSQFPVPDSLWLSAKLGCEQIVFFLLPFWPLPPLALLMYILPAFRYSIFQVPVLRSVRSLLMLYPILAAGGPLPLGSFIYREVSRLLQEIGSRFNDIQKIKLHFKALHHNDGEVPSLLSLCRIAARSSQPGGIDLPERLKLDPPGVKNILQLELDTAIIDNINEDIHKPTLVEYTRHSSSGVHDGHYDRPSWF